MCRSLPSKFLTLDSRAQTPSMRARTLTPEARKESHFTSPERGMLPLWSLTAPTSQSQEPSPPWLYCSLVANELSGSIRFMMLLLPSHSWRKSGNHNSIGATLSLCLGGGMLEYTRYCNASIKPLPTPWRLPENAHSPSAYWLPTFPLSPRAPSHNQADAGAYQAQTWKAFGCVCCVKRLSPFTVPTNPWVLGSDLLLQVFNSMLCDGSIPEALHIGTACLLPKCFHP